MEEMTVLAAAVTAAAAFAATNMDDLFVLMLLFGQARGADERRKIVLGQFLGVALLTAVSTTPSPQLTAFPAMPTAT